MDYRTVQRREAGEIEITREAALALLALPKTKERRRARRDANARLIAAAPELLAALKELVDIVEFARCSNDGKEQLDSFTLQPARAAIARATKGD